MDARIIHTIYKSEELYNRIKTPKSAFLLVFRYMEASILLSDKNIYLQKAMNIVVNFKTQDIIDTTMNLFEAYINIEFGQYDEADYILKKLKSFKAWYKTENPEQLAILLFLLAKNEFERKHFIRAKGNYKSFVQQLDTIKNNNFFRILQTMLIEKHIPDEANQIFTILYDIYNSGSRSPLLYMKIFYYPLYDKEKYNNKVFMTLINKSVRWSMIQGVDNQQAVTILQNYLKSNLFFIDNCTNTLELIYDKYTNPESLELLCKIYMEQMRVDKKALRIYLKAKKELNYLEKLDYIYIMAAYKNDYYNIEAKTIQKIISNVELNDELQSFVYHLILNDDNMKYMQPINHYKILNFGKTSFEKKIENVYYNSIYMFMFENDINNSILQKYIFEQLFAYEITIINSNVKYIWITEEEKQEIQSYVVKDNSIIINASTPDFKIYALGQRQRNFYDTRTSISIKKLLLNTNTSIYKFFWDRKIVNIELIIRLIKYYINQHILTQEAVLILQSGLEYTGISDKFKHLISVVLGEHFANRQEYDISKGYFSILKTNALTPQQSNTAIFVFCQTGNIDRAIELYISNKNISDKVKLSLCMACVRNKIYEKEISHISAELFLKGRSEKELIENILNFYEGTLEDWADIKRMFECLGINTNQLDEKILKKALYTHQINEYIQDIFVNVYNNTEHNSIIVDFIDYIIYMTLVQEKSFKNSLINCLEKEYNFNKNKYLQYCIASLYIINNIDNYKQEILETTINLMEKDSIMFPIFKRYKDKEGKFSYLEKNIPFIYNMLPDKKVYLNYKLKNEVVWHKKIMKYEKFGIYMTVLPMFCNEVLEYYIEQTDMSSVNEINQYINKNNTKTKENVLDEYYNINNAVIYLETFKYEQLESIISAQQSKKDYIKKMGYLI